jgi:hypothetical protein
LSSREIASSQTPRNDSMEMAVFCHCERSEAISFLHARDNSARVLLLTRTPLICYKL